MCSLTHRNTQVQVLIDLHGYTLGIEHTWNQVYYTHTPTHATHTCTHTPVHALTRVRSLSHSLTHSHSQVFQMGVAPVQAHFHGQATISPKSSMHWPYTLNILGP